MYQTWDTEFCSLFRTLTDLREMPNRLAKLLAIYCQDHPASTELQLLSSKILRISPPRSKGGSEEEEEGSNNPSNAEAPYIPVRKKRLCDAVSQRRPGKPSERDATRPQAAHACSANLLAIYCRNHPGRQSQAQDRFLFHCGKG